MIKTISCPHEIKLEGKNARLPIEFFGEKISSVYGQPLTLVLDIYAHRLPEHSHTKFGKWKFLLDGEFERITIIICVDKDNKPGISLLVDERIEEPIETWLNSECLWEPSHEIDVKILSGSDLIGELHTRLIVLDKQLLQEYYAQEEHQESYKSPENLFLEIFHQSRLSNLTKIFKRYIEDHHRVLDVGSGYSMFFLSQVDWRFAVTCLDMDEAAIKKMSIEAPKFNWVVGDAENLPFNDGEFDAVFAGEIIEHLPDPQSGILEWLRVLKPGGILILTTPNKARLINRINKEHTPVNPEHLSELSYAELNHLFRKNGLRIIKRRGIYLEFLFNYLRRGKKVDLLPVYFNKPRYEWLLRTSMFLGRLIPNCAFDLIYVVRKPK